MKTNQLTQMLLRLNRFRLFSLNTVDEHISTLLDLGFSISKARVFLALAKTGSQTAKEVSKSSGVARSDVYRVLDDLEKAGYVERILSKPEKFRSVKLESVITNLMEKRILETAELQERINKLKNSFKDCEQLEKNEENQFAVIPAGIAVYAKAEQMLKEVKEEICFLSYRRRLVAWLQNDMALIRKTISRGIKVRVIVPLPAGSKIDREFKILLKFPNFELKIIEEKPVAGFNVWDHKQALISTSKDDTPLPQPTLWSNSKAIVDMAENYFECVWKIAHDAPNSRN